MSEQRHRIYGIGFAVLGVAAFSAALFVLTRPGPSTPEGAEPDRPGKAGIEAGSEAGADLRAVAENRAPADSAAPEIFVLDVARNALQLHQEEIDPAEDLAILQDLLSQYRRIHGANPEGGLNFEIVASLSGGNERKLAVLPPDHPSLNREGELLDRWGTPYWFHPVSRDLMEIVSAGPDKNLWTEDDVRLD